MSKSDPLAPLTPAVFHILLALFGKERHGYDIMQQVQADSVGAVKMGPGTLYSCLSKLEEAGLIESLPAKDRRHPYRITAQGAASLHERLSESARVAKLGLKRLAGT